MRKSVLFVILIMLLLLTVSCGSLEQRPEVTPTPEASEAPEPSDSPTSDTITDVMYYIADPDTCELFPEVGFVNQGDILSPSQVMDFFVDSMADYSVSIGYKAATIESFSANVDTVVVDFEEEIKEIASENPDFEQAILDAVAQSMLDNFPDCSRIAFRIDGGDYITDNISLSAGDIYMDR